MKSRWVDLARAEAFVLHGMWPKESCWRLTERPDLLAMKILPWTSCHEVFLFFFKDSYILSKGVLRDNCFLEFSPVIWHSAFRLNWTDRRERKSTKGQNQQRTPTSSPNHHKASRNHLLKALNKCIANIKNHDIMKNASTFSLFQLSLGAISHVKRLAAPGKSLPSVLA